MKICKSVVDLRVALAGAPRPVGFVPTMGALHDGHASLVRRCRDECASVVASVYVNELQFDRRRDLDRYPRVLEDDCAILESLGANVVFAPDALYGDGHTTHVECDRLADVYEGAHRPGHFRGVCTVVLKLFHIVNPDRAYFGEKDAQQLAVIRAMVSDLDLAVAIVACETVRDADGLALSSRNAFLPPAQLTLARGISRGLFAAREAWAGGERDPERLCAVGRSDGIDYDYLACVDPETFQPPGPLMIAAARFGETRLIDNLRLDR